MGRFMREGTYVYLWLNHVDIWQKPKKKKKKKINKTVNQILKAKLSCSFFFLSWGLKEISVESRVYLFHVYYWIIFFFSIAVWFIYIAYFILALMMEKKKCFLSFLFLLPFFMVSIKFSNVSPTYDCFCFNF